MSCRVRMKRARGNNGRVEAEVICDSSLLRPVLAAASPTTSPSAAMQSGWFNADTPVFRSRHLRPAAGHRDPRHRTRLGQLLLRGIRRFAAADQHRLAAERLELVERRHQPPQSDCLRFSLLVRSIPRRLGWRRSEERSTSNWPHCGSEHQLRMKPSVNVCG